MTEKMKKAANRNPAMDIIRIVAVMLVIGVHFFLNVAGFKEQPVVGKRLLAAHIVRTLLVCCVPLFLMLSGYLVGRKKLEKKYYLTLSTTLLTYLLACIVCLIYKSVQGIGNTRFPYSVLAVLDYTGSPYGWYIEMYLGLFLLIPFLNILYNGLGTQRRKQMLMLTMATLTMLPSLFNSFRFYPAWWADPASALDTTQLFPKWWTDFYPVTYYFLGCYLREFGLKLKTSTIAILLGISVTGFGCFNFWRLHGGNYASAPPWGYGGFEPYILSVLLFTLLSRIKAEHVPLGVRYVLWKVSDLCLGVYLVSYIFDDLFYPVLNTRVPEFLDRLPWFPVITEAVFLCSLTLSLVLHLIGERIVVPLLKKSVAITRALLTKDKSRVQDAVFLLLLALLGGVALWKCSFGFGGYDEAFYLTIPHRLSLGDTLFKDEWHLSQMSGLLTVPFVWLYRTVTGSTEGIMLAGRYLYVGFHGMVALFGYSRLRRYGVTGGVSMLLYFLIYPL